MGSSSPLNMHQVCPGSLESDPMRLAVLVLVCLCAAPAWAQAAPIELGLSSAPGGAAALREAAPFGYRYQYLAGGANTGVGWATWNENGTFVTRYVDESAKAGITPVFSYFQIRGSLPGRDNDDEPKAVVG